ncbi:hypothetical protein BCV69DRAFT_301461 [Microstroma glucosiphilum]|uniref:Uncharacterized protein n=1 Tax=Pseudomicrostroma glucosiphilum TaxID=1684307 RepID=A0A316TZB5_9BASI|nr:hypothetical protein BCV69DRAFT_301461 [Pseudomicrostroma glucosiphilum]PWN18330.1 hypothetical protein BCV69DRAFT_301461 [Pseudomicrostroma glucosiphilum]
MSASLRSKRPLQETPTNSQQQRKKATRSKAAVPSTSTQDHEGDDHDSLSEDEDYLCSDCEAQQDKYQEPWQGPMQVRHFWQLDKSLKNIENEMGTDLHVLVEGMDRTESKILRVENILKQLFANSKKLPAGTTAAPARQPTKKTVPTAGSAAAQAPSQQSAGATSQSFPWHLISRLENIAFNNDYVQYERNFRSLVSLVVAAHPSSFPYFYLKECYLKPLPETDRLELEKAQPKTMEALYAESLRIECVKSAGSLFSGISRLVELGDDLSMFPSLFASNPSTRWLAFKAAFSTPTAASSTPTAASSTPTAASSTPTAAASTPTAAASTPTAASSTPTAASSTPTAASSTPTAAASTPTAASSTPTAAASTPTAASSTPTAASSTPTAASSTPTAAASGPTVSSSISAAEAAPQSKSQDSSRAL